MKQYLLTLLLCWSYTLAVGQGIGTSKVFAHNDYAGPIPFFKAYELRVGYIEADVFLKDGHLLVAHEVDEIDASKTLERLYLQPLNKVLNDSSNAGNRHEFTLMIDLKTEGVTTLDALVRLLKKYPELTESNTLSFMISGNVPDPALWGNYPAYIFFDGRPGIDYSPEQWERIAMISTNFRSHVQWDGRGELPSPARQRINTLVDAAHEHGKKFRFWATPDHDNAWRVLLDADMDVIVTDRPADLVNFLRTQR